MTNAASRLSLRLFGAPDVQVAGSTLVLSNQKACALLFYLGATAQSHTRDHLAALLWSESPISAARHSLRSTLYRLRRALQSVDADDALRVDGDLIGLRLADDSASDVVRFRRLLNEGDEPGLSEAIALYRGPLLQGFALADAPLFEEWLRFEEVALSQAHLRMLDQLAIWAEARQAWAVAIDYLRRIVQIDPLAENAQRRLIELYAREGSSGLALRQYRQFATHLQHELDLAPSAETQSLFDEVLAQRHASTISPNTHAATRAPHTLPFIGRDNLLTRLLAIAQDPIAQRGVSVLLQGEGGIGKTRLLEELVDSLANASPRWTILQGACSPFDDLLSYGPFLEALQNAAGDDATDLQTQLDQAAPDARGRFFYTVLQTLRTLAQRAPLVFAIEDLQWANSSTLNLFGFLAMRLRHLPVLLVGTVQRAEAIPALQRLITLSRRRGELHLLSLAPLSSEDVLALLRASGIRSTSIATLAEWLHERSGGSPFVLAEILAQLRSEAILTRTGDDWQLDAGRWLRWRATFTLPETTHDLVAWRLMNLTRDARRLLDVLAVAGESLPFAVLHTFPDFDRDQLIPALDDLVARQLIVEVQDEQFALPHHLLRETVLHRLSHIRRRAIHRQLAETLEVCFASRSDFPLRQVALHAVAGEDVERARRYGLQVLSDLPQDYTGAETVEFLHHLHDLLGPAATPDEMLHLTDVLGRLHQSLGHIDAATHWHTRQLHIALAANDRHAQATAHFEMSELALVTGDHITAATAAQAGLSACALSDTPPVVALVGRGHRLLGAALTMQGSDLPAAESHLQEAVAAHRRTNNVSDLCATLFELGNVAAQRGELGRALELYEEAAQAAEAGRVHYYLALARNNFAYHSLLLGQPAKAQRAAEQGLKLAEAYEMLGALLHLYNTEGEIYLYRAEWVMAHESFQRGLALAEELGHLERQAGYRASLALAARGQNELERATELFEEALALIADQGHWHLRTRILLWLAETCLLREHSAEATPHLEEALALAHAHGRTLLLVQGERLRARLLADRGDWIAANRLFAETAEQAQQLGLPIELARTQAAWGAAALRHSPSPSEASTHLAAAQAIFAAHAAQGDLISIETKFPSQR